MWPDAREKTCTVSSRPLEKRPPNHPGLLPAPSVAFAAVTFWHSATVLKAAVSFFSTGKSLGLPRMSGTNTSWVAV